MNSETFNDLYLLSKKLNLFLKDSYSSFSYELLTERSDTDFLLFVDISTLEVFVKKEYINNNHLIHSFSLSNNPFYISSLLSEYEDYLLTYVNCIKQQQLVFLNNNDYNTYVDLFSEFHLLLNKSISQF